MVKFKNIVVIAMVSILLFQVPVLFLPVKQADAAEFNLTETVFSDIYIDKSRYNYRKK